MLVLRFIFLNFWLCWVFVAAPRLSRWAGAMRRLLIAVASLVMEHKLEGLLASIVAALRLSSTISVVVTHGLSCPVACGIFLNQD